MIVLFALNFNFSFGMEKEKESDISVFDFKKCDSCQKEIVLNDKIKNTATLFDCSVKDNSKKMFVICHNCLNEGVKKIDGLLKNADFDKKKLEDYIRQNSINIRKKIHLSRSNFCNVGCAVLGITSAVFILPLILLYYYVTNENLKPWFLGGGIFCVSLAFLIKIYTLFFNLRRRWM
ncbi:hypothetical protein ACFLYH_00515 [Candidatus Dependentiae bacterium]